MLNKDEKLKLASYVLVSGYRERVLTILNEKGYMTPKYIAKHCNVRINHISKTLKELKTNGLIFCINEEARKGRLYHITPSGYEVLKLIPKLKEME